MIIDKVTIKISSGRGGNGVSTFRREKYIAHGGPDGGDGGRGGSVYLVADANMGTLLDFKYKSIYQAEAGQKGARKNCTGHSGEDLTIKVPCGTVVRDPEAGITIADLVEDGQKVLVAEGGRGGKGNTRYKSNKYKTPNFCEPGDPPVERDIELELKMIADVGIIGFPNAGKSTLISQISAAKAKVDDYAFTTIAPNLGVVKKDSGDAFVVADIPGLIEGASEGHGLGHEFLRHIERCRFLVHMIDVWGFEGSNVVTEIGSATDNKIEAYGFDDPVANYEKLQFELLNYSPKLAAKPQVVVLNKIEAYPEDELEKLRTRFSELFKRTGEPIALLEISAATGAGTKELKQKLSELVDQIETEETEVIVDYDPIATDHDDSEFKIIKDTIKGGQTCWRLSCGKLERIMKVTDIREVEPLRHLFNVTKDLGVFRELIAKGATTEDLLDIDGVEFELTDVVLQEDPLKV